MVVAACSQHAFAREGQRRDVSTGDTHRLVAEILDGGGSCSSAAVFEAALRSGFQVRMVESLPLEISCAVLSLAIWHNHGTGWQQKTYNAVSRYSDGENSA